jgi:hypothetical protein
MPTFTDQELDILRQLYDGRWFVISDHPLVTRHQALPDPEYEQIARAVGMQILHTRKGGGIIRVREAAPDDPIYRRGFVIGGRRKR